ncbi:MAG: AMP-binding protein [Lysinibacillus sp.]
MNRYYLSIRGLLEHAVERWPDKEAFFDDERRLSYRELLQEVRQAAAGLQALGIQKGDRIGICLPNWHEFVVLQLASGFIGAVIVPMNTRYRQDEASYIIANAGIRIVFIPERIDQFNTFTMYTGLQAYTKELEQVICVRFTQPGYLSYEDLLAKGTEPSITDTPIDVENDICTILYTSGTTGQPKGAMLTHKNVVHTAFLTGEALRCSDDDVLLVPVPLFHVFGLVASVLTSIAFGMRTVLMETFKAEKALQIIEQEHITVHHGVPTMFILELNHPNFARYDLTTLRTGIIAAAPCPVEIVKRIRQDMGCNIVVAYGLSETSPTLTVTDWDADDAIRSETVGKPLPGAKVRIVDMENNPLPANMVGEVVCQSFGVMKGYHNMPEETARAIDPEGWFHTGDLGTIDEEGHLRIVGRMKEMIIRGGYNIYPREVEEVLFAHPAVLEAAVVGLPDTVLGEISCAAVRLKEEASPEQLKAYISEHMAKYKVPDKIIILESFPMTASGKIKKIELQNVLREQLQPELR